MAEKMSWDDEPWLLKRQAEYNKRMSAYKAHELNPTSFTMMATHNEVVAEIDLLPYEEGGRRSSPSGDNRE